VTRDPKIATVVFPARDLVAGIEAWKAVFPGGPVFAGDDFAVFKAPGIEIGLTALPWLDEPLVFLDCDDIDQARTALLGSGAVGLGEVENGSLAEIGTAAITNGDAETGIVQIPGAKLAVVRLSDGSFVGLRQAL
jgi:hypothetical protein